MSQYQPMYDSFQRTPRDRYVPAPRINVAANVFLPASELDPCSGQLKPDHVRRRRTQAQRLEMEKQEREARKTQESLERELKKGGVRVTWITAAVLCCAMAFFCLFTIGYQLSAISAIQVEQNMVKAEIDKGKAQAAELDAKLKEVCDISKIGVSARDLGMIRADAMKAVHLTAVDTRPLEKRRPAAQQAPEINAQTQPTQIPMLASANN